MGHDKKVIIGVIGAGYWGPNLIRNFSSLINCDVKYVCDLDQIKLSAISKLYPCIKTTTDSGNIFNDKEVDAVVIATPVSTHFLLAKKALESGKHVFLEKPMAATKEECSILDSMACDCGLILTIDHTFLFTGAVRKITELMRAGEIGDIYYFDSERINLGLIQTDVNVLWD